MGSVVFITGASSDIGIELIKNISEDCIIIAHYHSSNKQLIENSKLIKNKLVTIHADLSIEKDIHEMLNQITSEYGIPDKIIHLAAPRLLSIRFKDVTWNDFEKDINISLKSIVLILNRFLPHLAKEKYGKVVIMLSSNVLGVPPKALAHYTTVKYAMLGLVKSLASEYAEKNITVNAISPSMIETKFLSNINEKLIEASAYYNPLKRNAYVTDIVPTILLLLSKQSDYINGINIPITAGGIF